MKQTYEDIQKLSPDALMETFTKTPFLKVALLSVAVHIVFVAFTSVGYVYRTFIADAPPPAGASAEAGGGATNAVEAVAASNGTATVAAPRPAAGGEAAADMEKFKNTPTVKAITEASKPEEIPGDPGLGISLDDTNPF